MGVRDFEQLMAVAPGSMAALIRDAVVAEVGGTNAALGNLEIVDGLDVEAS